MPKIENIYHLNYKDTSHAGFIPEGCEPFIGWCCVDHNGDDFHDAHTHEVFICKPFEVNELVERIKQANVPESCVLIYEDNELSFYVVSGLVQGEWPTLKAAFLNVKWAMVNEFSKRVLEPIMQAELDAREDDGISDDIYSR
tara:strand:+ start:146 stop:571 length:426 start_codon:yes stop_codon:yes gene_type:complete